MDTGTHTDRMLGEDKGRGGGDAAEAKEHQRRPANPQQLEKGMEQSLSGSPEGTSPAETLIWAF